MPEDPLKRIDSIKVSINTEKQRKAEQEKQERQRKQEEQEKKQIELAQKRKLVSSYSPIITQCLEDFGSRVWGFQTHRFLFFGTNRINNYEISVGMTRMNDLDENVENIFRIYAQSKHEYDPNGCYFLAPSLRVVGKCIVGAYRVNKERVTTSGTEYWGEPQLSSSTSWSEVIEKHFAVLKQTVPIDEIEIKKALVNMYERIRGVR